jgi:hypothetical protein
MHHTDLVPGCGHAGRLAEVLEALASFLIGSQRLRIPTLVHSNGAELALSGGIPPVTFQLPGSSDHLLIRLRRFVESPQVSKAVSLLGQRCRSHSRRAATGLSPLDLDRIEPPLRVLQQEQPA